MIRLVTSILKIKYII